MRGMLCWVLVSIGAGCAPTSRAISDAERRAIEAEVRGELDSLAEAWATLDAQGVVRHYADSAVDTYNGERSTGIAPLNEWAKNGYDNLSRTEIGPFQDLRFDVLARDAVVVSWVNSFTETNRNGERQPEQIAFMTQVWVRQNGGWRLLHNHESTRAGSEGE